MLCMGQEYRSPNSAKSGGVLRIGAHACGVEPPGTCAMRETENPWVGRRRTVTPPAPTPTANTTHKHRLDTPLTRAERWKAACQESALANSISAPRWCASQVIVARASHDDAAAAASEAALAAAAAPVASAAARQPLRWPDTACSGGGGAAAASQHAVSTQGTKLWYLQREDVARAQVEAAPPPPPAPPHPAPWRSSTGAASDGGELLAARMDELRVASDGVQARAYAAEETVGACAADVGQLKGELQGALPREGALERWRASGAARCGQGLF